MAPRELPIIVAFAVALNSVAVAHVYRVVQKPHPIAGLGDTRPWSLGLAVGFAMVFAAIVVRRQRTLVAAGLLRSGRAPVDTYRSHDPTDEAARRNAAVFGERWRCAAGWLVPCLAAASIHRAPLAWSAWLSALAVAGAATYVRFRDGAEWAIALPFFSAAAYAASGNPLVGVPQLALFVLCWVCARFAETADPSSGWATARGRG